MNLYNKEETGKVWLVGAGPSDPGLMTIKGKSVLDKADAVVFDALIGEGIRGMIPTAAQQIYVGKRSNQHAMPQEEINQLLVRLAKEGKRVVRLKGGDPFLFGRGGEEVELLVREGIPFEVVPGITSAIAVPAYQGIPVTHRDFCSSVHVITGHRRAGQSLDIDFAALVRAGGTLVFLMGVAALAEICQGLLDAGMEADMPAALLIRGTTGHQQRLVATVSTLSAEVEKQGALTPAIIVVGRVCALADTFSWQDKLPLSGKRILLTRPAQMAEDTAEEIRTLGAEVVVMPAIRTEEVEEKALLYQEISRIEAYDWLVLTSPIGVRVFFTQLHRQRVDLRRLSHLRIAAMGSGTERELNRFGLYADLLPSVYDVEHLALALRSTASRGEAMLIPRSAMGNPRLIEILQRGEGNSDADGEGEERFRLCEIPTYRTVTASQPRLPEVLAEGIDAVIFTSSSGVRGFADSAQGVALTDICAVCIGAQTAAEAQKYGMQTRTAEAATIEALISCLLSA